ncbi:M48 family metallopeptidase [Candidatus Peregrinibacteria bacterium]|jgi:predicted metal-dependent hydrolase|nr:M48 family metallopeptidase [Candidatus Peregrinibacteria bacterium]MBT4147833.1 M48 family metallopeptidase [Candidatus Peregrinibacteria bacterium]MBT4366174.1 M48 family metallopeptidase [Candidatus Peregrinibacteria bacterium]MBT4455579.1 M48 family metallopeptidase [Candidatus Peregrinibacteria bacterium]
MKYPVVRSSRRTLCIQIHPEKGVVIRAPRRLSDRRIEKFLKEKEEWIRAKSAQQTKCRAQKPTRSFEPGETFPLLGEPTKPPVHTRTKIIEWYKMKATDHLKKRTHQLAKKLEEITGRQVQPRAIKIRSYRSRWGTCHRDNSITYNWKVVMASPEIVDYLIAHELTHILHKNHGPNFKKTLALMDPEYKKNQKWLRSNGARLDV